MSRIVFTGPPCSGKSSVFDAIIKTTGKDFDYVNYPELARVWLSFFEEYEPEKHPSKDRRFFQKFLETMAKRNWVGGCLTGQPAFYDRGLIDEIGYQINFGMLIEATHLLNLCKKKFRYDKVFFFPFWEDIYVCDNIRKETEAQAIVLQDDLKFAYKESGYEVIIVPFGTVEERVQFIKDNI